VVRVRVGVRVRVRVRVGVEMLPHHTKEWPYP